MSNYRITLTFDLTMTNPESARHVAADFTTDRLLQGIADGGRVEGDVEGTLNSPRAMASALAAAILARGAATVDGVEVANVSAQHDPL